MGTNGKVSINLGYIAGFSSLIAAVVYFYASNWGMLERWQKFTPLFLFTIGFYVLSVYLAKRPGRILLSRLSLLGSSIAFGIGVAVVGQTYNSHADSYSLFAVWFAPALLFAFLSRWQPFYVLAYGLGHMTYGAYFSPVFEHMPAAEGAMTGILAALAVIQALIFYLTERKWLHSPVIRFLSFILLIGLLLMLSNTFQFEKYGWLWNIPLALLLAGCVLYFKRTGSRMYFLWTGLAISASVIVKYFEITAHYYNEAFFIYSLLFIIVFISGNVWFLQRLQTIFPSEEELKDAAAAQTDTAPEPVAGRSRHMQWMIRVLTVSAITIGTILGSFSLVGFLVVVLDISNLEPVLAAIGLVFSIGMLALRKANVIFRYTLLISGIGIMTGTALAEDNTLLLWGSLAVTLAAFLLERGKFARSFFYSAALVIANIALYDWWRSEVIALTILIGVLLAVLAVHHKAANEEIRLALRYCSYPAFLLASFILTFITHATVYYVVNALFFVVTLLLALWAGKRHAVWVQRVSLGFWMAYVCWKYYDMAWKLLHKSITLAVAGVLIMAIVYVIERRGRAGYEPGHLSLRVSGRIQLLLGLIVLLQVIVLGMQIAQSERKLTHGQTIKLELAPIDPRSLLQGDYVKLRYTIASPEAGSRLGDDLRYNQKVAVVLEPAASGVYLFKEVLRQGAARKPGEIVLNGKWNGYNGFIYGIENYFVPEGTGREVERTAKFAEVKVGTNGDAILVRLLSE